MVLKRERERGREKNMYRKFQWARETVLILASISARWKGGY